MRTADSFDGADGVAARRLREATGKHVQHTSDLWLEVMAGV